MSKESKLIEKWIEEKKNENDIAENIIYRMLKFTKNRRHLSIIASCQKEESFALEDIAKEMGVSHSSISNTFRTLENFDIFDKSRFGRDTIYKIKSKNYHKFIKILKDLEEINKIERTLYTSSDFSKCEKMAEKAKQELMELYKWKENRK